MLKHLIHDNEEFVFTYTHNSIQGDLMTTFNAVRVGGISTLKHYLYIRLKLLESHACLCNLNFRSRCGACM